MCLGIPGQLVQWLERDGVGARGVVAFSGVRKICHLACVPEAEVGDYLLVHAGIAICRLDQAAAARVLAELKAVAETYDDEISG